MEDKKTLKEIRKERGVSQIKAAEHLSISRDALRRKENGTSPWKMEQVAALCTYYNCTYEDIKF